MGCCISDHCPDDEDGLPRFAQIKSRSCLLHQRPNDFKGFVKSSNCWVRVTRGTDVTVLEKRGLYSHVEVHGMLGWIRSSIITHVSRLEVKLKRRLALVILWIMNMNEIGGSSAVSLLTFLTPGIVPWWLVNDSDQLPKIKTLPVDRATGVVSCYIRSLPVPPPRDNPAPVVVEPGYVPTRSTVIASRIDTKLIINGKVFDADPFRPVDVLAWRSGTVFPAGDIPSFACPQVLPEDSDTRWALPASAQFCRRKTG